MDFLSQLNMAIESNIMKAVIAFASFGRKWSHLLDVYAERVLSLSVRIKKTTTHTWMIQLDGKCLHARMYGTAGSIRLLNWISVFPSWKFQLWIAYSIFLWDWLFMTLYWLRLFSKWLIFPIQNSYSSTVLIWNRHTISIDPIFYFWWSLCRKPIWILQLIPSFFCLAIASEIFYA